MIVIHIPHASTHIPDDLRPAILLNDAELDRELLRMTDRYTDEMAPRARPGGVAILECPVSRLVCDVERFRDDSEEPMSRVGMGAVYTRTSDRRLLRQAHAEGREAILRRFYDPHHEAFTRLVSESLEGEGRCIILDLHSFPSLALPYEPGASLRRPEICIGTDDYHTPEALAQAAEGVFGNAGLETVRNEPFAGAIAPAAFYRTDPRVTSVMIEVRRDLYMNEATGERTPGLGVINHLIDSLAGRLLPDQDP